MTYIVRAFEIPDKHPGVSRMHAELCIQQRSQIYQSISPIHRHVSGSVTIPQRADNARR